MPTIVRQSQPDAGGHRPSERTAPRPSGVTLKTKPTAEATLVVSLDAAASASILRGFDELRRWLSASLHGTTGAFTGFHHLDIHHRALELLAVGDEITMTARVVRDVERQTSIEFVATLERLTVSGWRAETQVAAGTGVVIYPIGLPQGPSGRSPTQTLPAGPVSDRD